MSERKTFAEKLSKKLKLIDDKMMDLLDISIIKEFHNDPSSEVVFIRPPFYFETPGDEQRKLQISISEIYLDWLEKFKLLFTNATSDIEQDNQRN